MLAGNYSTSDFSVRAPQTWQRKSIVTLLEPGVEPLPRSLVVTQDVVGGIAIEDYAKRQEAELMAHLPGFHVERRGTLTVAGCDVPLLAYSWRPADRPALAQFQVYFCRAPHAWILTGTASQIDAHSFEPLFLAMAGSFTPE